MVCKNVKIATEICLFKFILFFDIYMVIEARYTALRDLSYILYSKVILNSNGCTGGQTGKGNHHLYASKMMLVLFV